MAEIFKTRIEGIAAGGAGFARLEGKSVFIEGSAAGETVCCRITEEHNSWAKAELLEIVEASPDRVQPACAFYGVCGGCNLQHISYSGQLAAKTAILGDAFKRIGGVNPPQPMVFPSQPWEYRNRMQFHRTNPAEGSKGSHGAVGFGLKAHGSGDVVPVSDCPVADPGIRAVLRAAVADRAAGRADAPALALPLELNRFTVYARDGLLLNEGGTRRGKTKVLDRELTIDAALFFQSNGAMLEALVSGLREIVADESAADNSAATSNSNSRRMADIYCGVGTFAACLGEYFTHVDLVEENRSALSLARENLAPLSSAGTTMELYALRDDAWAKNAASRSSARPTAGGTMAGATMAAGGSTNPTAGLAAAYRFIVVDPPRQGLAPGLARWLAAKGPPLLAYVSCDPATLARDSGILVGGGYELAELRFYDFYPQTAHIESLALFRRRGDNN